MFTISQASRILNVPYNTLRYRVKKNLLKFKRTPFGPLISKKEIAKYRREREKRGLR